jgi:hypothetical protein
MVVDPSHLQRGRLVYGGVKSSYRGSIRMEETHLRSGDLSTEGRIVYGGESYLRSG